MKLRNKKTGMIEKAYITMYGDKLAVIVADMPLCGNSVLGEYNSLAELNEEWEDYAPKEPLIKDEKIRKAVRAWAEACFNDNEFWVIYLGERNFTLKANRSDAKATFYSDNKIDGIEEDEFYTITELCGEEE